MLHLHPSATPCNIRKDRIKYTPPLQHICDLGPQSINKSQREPFVDFFSQSITLRHFAFPLICLHFDCCWLEVNRICVFGIPASARKNKASVFTFSCAVFLRFDWYTFSHCIKPFYIIIMMPWIPAQGKLNLYYSSALQQFLPRAVFRPDS